MKRIGIILLAVLAIAGIAVAEKHTISSIPNVHLDDANRYVSNPDNVISSKGVAELDAILKEINDTTSCEVAAVIVDDIDTDDEEIFITDLFNEWGLGKENDNGIMIFLSKGRRFVTIRTGDGAEGVLPDILCGRVTEDTMTPLFKDGDYEGGLIAGAKEIQRIVSDPAVREEMMADVERENIIAYCILGGFFLFAGGLIFKAQRNKRLRKKYAVCEYCKKLAAETISDVVTIPNTECEPGEGIRTYHCRKCGREYERPYKIESVAMQRIREKERNEDDYHGRRGSGGSSSGGGSWGGGHSSGGGATSHF